jgi:hypothetical protein
VTDDKDRQLAELRAQVEPLKAEQKKPRILLAFRGIVLFIVFILLTDFISAVLIAVIGLRPLEQTVSLWPHLAFIMTIIIGLASGDAILNGIFKRSYPRVSILTAYIFYSSQLWPSSYCCYYSP